MYIYWHTAWVLVIKRLLDEELQDRSQCCYLAKAGVHSIDGGLDNWKQKLKTSVNISKQKTDWTEK